MNDPLRSDSLACRAIWERLASWWDQNVGEGNEFQRELIIPATDRLIGIGALAGKRVLDVGCGNGNYARKLGRAGALVTAIDFSSALIECARRRTIPDGAIEYLVVDATDESAIRRLAETNRGFRQTDAEPQRAAYGHPTPIKTASPEAPRSKSIQFDHAVCSMAIMDMPTIDPLLRGLAAVLKPGGRFVFSVPHPCFNSNQSTMTAELVNAAGRLEQVYGLKIVRYAEVSTDLSPGILNQPEPHYLFHRPIGSLLASAFAAGFVLDGLEEPTYPADAGAKNAFSWKKRPSIPPALVVRLRLI